MDVVTYILFAIGLILFFGYFAGFVFKKYYVPDVFLLIILGIIMGRHFLDLVNINTLQIIAPVFTTFTLIFLLFDGAFNIDLSSLLNEFSGSFVLTVLNFVTSSLAITLVLWVIGYFVVGLSFTMALLGGFLLGGVSSAFSIPILKQLNVNNKIYSLLMLESALTDVFCIVFSLSVIQFLKLGNLGLQGMLTQFMSFFAIACLVGLIAGVIWVFLILKVFKQHNYIMTVAFLLVVYFITEYLNGNGAIAALFFGIILKNSKTLSSILKGISSDDKKHKTKALSGKLGVSVTTPHEEEFYHHISFLLKTFFFVYIGILIDFSDWKIVLIGLTISGLILSVRMISQLVTKKYKPSERKLIDSVFARGLAAAAIAQLAVQSGLSNAEFISGVTYIVIFGTIFLSSVRIFIYKFKEGVNDGTYDN